MVFFIKNKEELEFPLGYTILVFYFTIYGVLNSC